MTVPYAGRAVTTPLRLLLVDDHEMVLGGLKAMLARYRERIEVVATARSREEALAAQAALAPEVVLLDIRLGPDSGLDLCTELRSRDEVCQVVFLTVYDDEQYLFQALRAGAAGFLLKRVQGEELAEHLERVRTGVIVIDPTLAGRVAESAARLHRGEFWPGAHMGLTQRESEVLGEIVAGCSNRAIGTKLFISEETVKSHTRSIDRKLDVSDRAQAVGAALREGLFR